MPVYSPLKYYEFEFVNPLVPSWRMIDREPRTMGYFVHPHDERFGATRHLTKGDPVARTKSRL